MFWHESTLSGRIELFLNKAVARITDLDGCFVNLESRQLPSLSRLERVRTCLDDLVTYPKLDSELPTEVGRAFELIHSALIVPDLWERADKLRSAGKLLRENPTLARGVKRSPKERNLMYESSDRLDVVKAFLESASFQFDCCVRWTNNIWGWGSCHTEADIERCLDRGMSRIVSARENLPLLDIEGW